jgi:pyruvate kinase
MRKTKIVCTLGPSTEDDNILKELMLSGMNVARFNFSHQTREQHKERFDQFVRIRDELGLPIAALLDTKGPEIRVKKFKNDKISLKKGDVFTLTTRDIEGDQDIVSITYADLINDVEIGTRILIDDGLIELIVKSITQTDIVCDVINGGCVSNNKGVNVPGIKLSMPYMSEKDKQDIIFGAKHGFDFIAASFTRTSDDIIQIREVLEEVGCNSMRIIAKIENADGVKNIDDIIRVSDGIMIARGDMGVEIDFEDLPVIQKELIKKAYNSGKHVITATQMLDSMMKNPRPTRAETSDVANAIYDGTSAIMLSGETAAGAYPIESIQAMVKIAVKTEDDIDYKKRFNNRNNKDKTNVTDAISHATVTTAHDLDAKAIITVTKLGKTARMISKYRPCCPIIGCTTESTVCRQMNLSWGILPIMMDEMNCTDDLFKNSLEVSKRAGIINDGDIAVITAGVPLGISGTTNLLKVSIVGED